MPTLHNSLAEVASGYSVFEKDQVLTEAQLNSVSQYLDDQDRISRIQLTGTGIVCGLTIRFSNDQIQLETGTGITTDGDLIQIDHPITFDRYKLYGTDAPRYSPFYLNDTTMLPVYELVPVGATDVLAHSLVTFTSDSNDTLSAMTALLLMESYIKDDDLCTGSDCDNHGQDYVSRPKLLLIASSQAGALMPQLQTSRQASRTLPQLTIPRVQINATTSRESQLNTLFLTACQNMVQQLTQAFSSIWPQAGFLLQGQFDGDPGPGWTTRLQNLQGSISNTTRGVQYYYDFLVDLCHTWNDFKSTLYTDRPWCNPDINGFPKHLLLGNLTNPQQNRFDFYPSAAINRHHTLDHARFLARKIQTLLEQFSLPGRLTTIKITPSSLTRPLEHSAIPCYYQIDEQHSVVEYWNFALHQQGMSAHNYGYHADSYEATGAASDPLQYSLNEFDFFRIEGHLDLPINTALNQIKNSLNAQQLPFSVTSVLIGTSHTGIVGRRGAGYNDLHRLHYLLRQDLSHNLNDVNRFSNRFKQNIDTAIEQGVINDETTGSDSVKVSQLSERKNAAITARTKTAQQKINLPYSQYRADTSWKSDISDTMTNVGEYKFQLGKVVKTEFNTPFDILIGGTRVEWLDWLDVLIDQKDQQQDEKRLLRSFVQQYPGMEHTGGVIRGGTFVLLYDSSGTVVGDIMLSHYLPEPEQQAAEEPTLPKPGIRPGWVIDSGINLLPSRDHYFGLQMTDFKTGLDREWNTKFNLQTTYTDAFKESLGIIDSIYQIKSTNLAGGDVKAGLNDDILNSLTGQMAQDRTLIEKYRQGATDDSLPDDSRQFYQRALQERQQNLIKTIGQAAEYMSINNTEVNVGSDGYQVLQGIEKGVGAVTDNQSLAREVSVSLGKISDSSSNRNLANGIKIIMGGIG
ncbi:hypothetical protein [Gynuella sp.]|uniref:hypothetical protein n=1 Tax=Gynuella sp. TaxID=2969146 RepID=UPI003D0F12D8